MHFPSWLQPPRHLLALFGVVTLGSAVVLAWLGWQVIGLDRRLEVQRTQEHLDHAADRLAAGISRQLNVVGLSLPGWLREPPEALSTGGVVAAFGPHGLEEHVGSPLVFVPVLEDSVEPPDSTWERAERLEQNARDAQSAIAAYRSLAGSSSRAVHAGALIRLAGVFKTSGQSEEALAVYRELAGESGVRIMGEPVDLIARAAACELLARGGRRSDLEREAATLARDLASGRWLVDRGTYEFRSAQIGQWVPMPDASTGIAIAGAIQTAWIEHHAGKLPVAAAKTVWQNGRGVLLVWQPDGDRWLIFAAASSFLERAWHDLWSVEPISVALLDREDHHVLTIGAGHPGAGVVRMSADTGLPWTFRVSAAPGFIDAEATTARRRLVVAGVVIMTLVVLGGGWLVARAVRKELAVAQLQSDFVSAVSHEFRTPLTAMTHLTDRLQRDASIPDDRRRQYYDALARDTHRLGRFVETLLDFGRMEAGTASLPLERADLGALVTDVVDEFRADPAAGDHRVTVCRTDGLPPVRVDRASLGRALWNLLDNAAKYSPSDAPIDVELASDHGRAAIRVRDRGPGVPFAERQRIFERFVRGAAHETSGVRGTGVGLAMVSQIARAHAGVVTLDSEVGLGSTFSIVLPPAADDRHA